VSNFEQIGRKVYNRVRNFIYTLMLNYGVSCKDLNDTHSYATPDRSGNMGRWV